MITLLDFSQKTDLRILGALVSHLSRAAEGRPYLLAGATARDLLLHHAHDIELARATVDVDFAFLTEHWDQFHALRQRLLSSGEFSEVSRHGLHRLRFRNALDVDLLPFGEIEREDRTIAWPPDNRSVMTMFGFREALSDSVTVKLPDNAEVKVVSLPALAVLKLVAWKERRMTAPGKDAYDLRLILEKYLDAGNYERFFQENPDAGGSPFDYETAGAWLLGKDMAALLDVSGHQRLGALISTEADETGSLQLVSSMWRNDLDLDRGLVLLTTHQEGFQGRQLGH